MRLKDDQLSIKLKSCPAMANYAQMLWISNGVFEALKRSGLTNDLKLFRVLIKKKLVIRLNTRPRLYPCSRGTIRFCIGFFPN